MSRLVVVGAPGSGKSTVGARLAQRLGVDLVDVDQRIEDAAGKPVSEIFADDGEPYFRTLEVQHTLAALELPGVISLGGGAVTSESIRAALDGHTVVWLKVSASNAARRVGLTVARPLLLGNVHGRLVRLLAERTPLYEQVATVVVETDDVAPDEVVEMIVQQLAARA